MGQSVTKRAFLPDGRGTEGRAGKQASGGKKKKSGGDRRADAGCRGHGPEVVAVRELLSYDGAPVMSQLTPQLTDRQA